MQHVMLFSAIIYIPRRSTRHYSVPRKRTNKILFPFYVILVKLRAVRGW